jgi:antitoxin MazE
VRLPLPIVEALELAEGDELEIDLVGSRRVEVMIKPDLDALLARLRRLHGKMTADFNFDRLEAIAR